MNTRELNKYINKTVEIVNEYTDREGSKPTVEVKRLFNRKCVEVIFWHGTTPEVRKQFLDGRINHFDWCGSPVIFDNHQGGGDVQSFTIMWTQSMTANKITAEELFKMVLEENSPLDKSWLNHLRKERTDEQLLEWAKENVEQWAPSNTSKRTINAAAELLVKHLF